MLKRICFSHFKVYLAEITADTQTCAKRNVHGRTLKDIMKVYKITNTEIFVWTAKRVTFTKRIDAAYTSQ